MRILLVEDDEMLADGLVRALRHDGYAVDHVARGDLAQAAVEDGRFDAVLLDLGLPGMDGLEVQRALRRRRPPVPVIVSSAPGKDQSRSTSRVAIARQSTCETVTPSPARNSW